MKRGVNKFGVPYHAYRLTLDDGRKVEFDMAWEEYWGSVQEWNAEWNGGSDEPYVGYGNEVDGFRKIVSVYDEKAGAWLDPFAFLRRANLYAANYAT